MKISVLTPSYNSGPYLEKCIQSVLNQDYKNFEHIIVDGGSTDETLEILKKYDHLIWISEKDNGQSDAMNKAFEMSTGEIIVYCNADDYFAENIFLHILNIFKQYPDTDIVVGNLNNEFYNGRKSYITAPEIEFKKIILTFKYPFPHNPVSYFYKRKVQERVGLFPLEEHYGMDYWFLIHAFRLFRTRKTDRVLGTFYRTGFNKTSQTSSYRCTAIAKEYIHNVGGKLFLFYYFNKSIYLIKRVITIDTKTPIKRIVHFLFFRKIMNFYQFMRAGVKNSFKKYYSQNYFWRS